MPSDEEMDELDALMFEAHAVTFEADMVAHRLVYGLVPLDEARQFVADTDTSNVYVDLSYLENTIILLEMSSALGPV